MFAANRLRRLLLDETVGKIKFAGCFGFAAGEPLLNRQREIKM